MLASGRNRRITPRVAWGRRRSSEPAPAESAPPVFADLPAVRVEFMVGSIGVSAATVITSFSFTMREWPDPERQAAGANLVKPDTPIRASVESTGPTGRDVGPLARPGRRSFLR